MKKWEYKKVIMVDISEDYLNKIGDEGWELVSFNTNFLYDKAIFKREMDIAYGNS